jgi:hypothetical protein
MAARVSALIGSMCLPLPVAMNDAKRAAVYCASDFYEAARAKEFYRLGPYDIGPSAFTETFFQDCTEALVLHVVIISFVSGAAE